MGEPDWADRRAREWLLSAEDGVAVAHQECLEHDQPCTLADELADLLREVANNPKYSEVYGDFCKCYDIAMLAESYWPDLLGKCGTVSERLKRVLTKEHEAREAAEHKLAEVLK